MHTSCELKCKQPFIICEAINYNFALFLSLLVSKHFYFTLPHNENLKRLYFKYLEESFEVCNHINLPLCVHDLFKVNKVNHLFACMTFNLIGLN